MLFLEKRKIRKLKRKLVLAKIESESIDDLIDTYKRHVLKDKFLERKLAADIRWVDACHQLDVMGVCYAEV